MWQIKEKFLEYYGILIMYILLQFYMIFWRSITYCLLGPGEIAQDLKALAALPEDPHLVRSTIWWLTTICNSCPRGSYVLF